ncbi:MAG: sigma 54-interacting transcriptional regulator [Blastocatellia bacterium]
MLRRYQTLLDVGRSIVSHLDLRELIGVTSEHLRRVINCDGVWMTLYDADSGQMRVFALDPIFKENATAAEGQLVPMEGTPSAQVMKSLQTIIVTRSMLENSSSAAARSVAAGGLQSGCIAPLISQGRAIGTIAMASQREDAFTREDAELFTQIAGQIAIAVDNALNFARARQAEQEVTRQLKRERLMLEINNAVVSQLDPRDLVRVTASCLREVLHHDIVGMSLYDPATDQLRAYAFDFPDKQSVLPDGTPIPLKGTMGGKAFTTGQPVFINRAEPEKNTSDFNRRFLETGVRSGGCVPLIVHGRKLGVLGFASFREDAFPDDHQQLLSQIADQIAIAVENALNFERARQAEQEVKHQLDRERLLLEINNAVVSQLDLRDLVQVISACLCKALRLAIAGVSLYDPEAGCLRAYYYDLPDTLTPIEPGTSLPLEGSIAGLTFTSGQPVLLNRAEQWEAFPVSKKLFCQTGINSGGCVPLIVQGRKLGVLGVDSYQEDAFPEERQQLLCQIADQLALAVDNALNFERARKAEQEIRRRFERERLMLEINNAVVSNLNLAELLTAISASLRRVVPHDFAGLALYDADIDQLRVQALDAIRNREVLGTIDLIPLKGTGAGKAFTARKTIRLRSFDPAGSSLELVRRFVAAGFKSSCHVPLISRDRALGTLDVMSVREDAFSGEDAELLTSIGQQIAIAVDNALAYREIEALKNKVTEEKLYLEEEIKSAWSFEEIIGSSPALRRILKQVETVAPTDSTVLIQGETGTGKELIARAIHNLSARRERTLVKLNCAAIPTGLLESELFGHEKGSFTGAIAQRIGRFELAHKGTMFLDEVGEIPLELQPKLLRVLQEQEFERLGSARTQRVDVRLIAATNRDLGQMAGENKFRSDLFYRLNVFPITIPPLRERPEDVPLLVRFFANKFALRMKKQIETISAETVAALQRYHWPGNIRELENLIERAVILTQGAELNIPLTEINIPAKKAVPVSTQASTPSASESDALEAIEREHILRVLNETRWVVGGPNGAAARLEMKRTTLQARMKKLGISRQP